MPQVRRGAQVGNDSPLVSHFHPRVAGAVEAEMPFVAPAAWAFSFDAPLFHFSVYPAPRFRKPLRAGIVSDRCCHETWLHDAVCSDMARGASRTTEVETAVLGP